MWCSCERVKALASSFSFNQRLFYFESLLAFRKKNELLDAKLPIDSALSGWPKIFVPENSQTSLRHGKTISVEGFAPLGFVTIYSKKSKLPDEFLGIGESLANGRLSPKKMLVN